MQRLAFDHVKKLKGSSQSQSAVAEPPLAASLPSHIPSLDGMRAVCILAVCFAHLVHHPALYAWVGHLGNYGVRIFFIISGFLITTLLLKEYDACGRISLKQFYMRRVLRIFPAFYAYATVILGLWSLGAIRLSSGDILHTLTYTMNYEREPAWFLTHTWSLSVEEQFYALWPMVLVTALPRRGLKIALGAALVVPVVRAATYYFLVLSPSEVPVVMGREFQVICDALATGCVLAGAYNRIGACRLYRAAQATPAYILIPGCFLVASALTYKVSVGLYYVVGQSLANIGGVLLIDYVVRVPASVWGRILNTAPFEAVGRWSYSIYLWQQVFLAEGRSSFALSWPLNVVGLATASLASYYGIELPFQRLRRLFRRAEGRPHASRATA